MPRWLLAQRQWLNQYATVLTFCGFYCKNSTTDLLDGITQKSHFEGFFVFLNNQALEA